MAFALIASASANVASGTATTAGIDTTGANLIVAWSVGDSSNLTDSNGNTWTSIQSGVDGVAFFDLRYCLNPTVGAGHTFSNGTGRCSVAVSAWSGALSSLALDVSNAGTAISTSLATGSVTPSVNDSLVVAVLGNRFGGSNPNSITVGTIIEDVFTPGPFGAAMAYEIQTTATTRNPTWSWTGSTFVSAAIAVFKPSFSPDVTVSLTGIGSTASAGTLVATRTLAAAGIATTSAAGTVAPARSFALTGIAATPAQGSVTTSRTFALTGSAATPAAGTVAPGTGVAVAGSAVTSAAGTLAAERTLALAGAAATGSLGTLLYAASVALTGSSAGTAAGTVGASLPAGAALTGEQITLGQGSVGISISVAAAGSAGTMSTGTLAYSATFTLAGISSGAVAGSLSTGGGDASQAIKGISVKVRPGNVRVTGGTRWVPQAPRAVTLPSTVGNTIPPPPRMTGNTDVDLRALVQWTNDLYSVLAKTVNVTRAITEHETRISNLENN